MTIEVAEHPPTTVIVDIDRELHAFPPRRAIGPHRYETVCHFQHTINDLPDRGRFTLVPTLAGREMRHARLRREFCAKASNLRPSQPRSILLLGDEDRSRRSPFQSRNFKIAAGRRRRLVDIREMPRTGDRLDAGFGIYTRGEPIRI